MGIYRQKPHTFRSMIRVKLVALAWAGAFLAAAFALAWLARHSPHPLAWAVGPVRFAGVVCFFGAVFAVAFAIVGGFNFGRRTFELTITPAGVRRRTKGKAENDVFLPRDEITGFYDTRYFIRILTADPFRHVTIQRSIDGFDECRRELMAMGILPIAAPPNASSAMRSLFGGFAAVLVGTGMVTLTQTPAAIVAGFVVAAGGMAATTWITRRNPDRSSDFLWSGVVWAALTAFERIMRLRGHDLGHNFQTIALGMCFAIAAGAPWVRRAAQRFRHEPA
jgi:hypothetical protein